MLTLSAVSSVTTSPKNDSLSDASNRATPKPGEVYSHSPYTFKAIQAPMPLDKTPSETSSEFVSKESSKEEARRSSMHAPMDVLYENIGRFVEMSRTAHGSSFLQAAIQDNGKPAVAIILAELEPAIESLLQDTHACYVVKVALEHGGPKIAVQHIHALLQNVELVVSLCTLSLHSRRMIQFFVDTVGASPFHFIVMSNINRIASTQHGCITVQRILDRCTVPEKEALFDVIRNNLFFCTFNPYWNYVVQYMLEHGNTAANTQAVQRQLLGRLPQLACDKYASNVLEMVLINASVELQHRIIVEIFGNSDVLGRLLVDTVGNYIIQTAVNVAPYRDMQMIGRQLLPLLGRVPYGKKIENRVLRRLRGKVQAPYDQ